MSLWPSSLIQYPLRASFAESPGDNLLRTSSEQGPGKRRRAFTAVDDPVTCSVVLRSQEEKDLLRGWFTGTLASGALSFQWPQLSQALGALNLVSKSTFEDLQLGQWQAFGSAPLQPGFEPPSTSYFILQAGQFALDLKDFHVAAGERFWCEATIWSGPANFACQFGVSMLNAANQYAGQIVPCEVAAGQIPTHLTGSGVVPDGAILGRGIAQFAGPSGSDFGLATFGNLYVGRAPRSPFYQFASPPQFAKRGARGWTAELSLVRKP